MTEQATVQFVPALLRHVGGSPASHGVAVTIRVRDAVEVEILDPVRVKDLGTFRRFLGLLAARHGNILNRTDIAAPLGVSVPTVSEWLSVLEITGQILLVPPYFENFGKRLIKSPKIYFTDSGLACHLLCLDTLSALRRSAMYGALFEGFVAAEIAKLQLNAGRRLELYYFRDQQGLEVDFVVPHKARKLLLIEAKATRTPPPAMTRSLQRLRASIDDHRTQPQFSYMMGPQRRALGARSPRPLRAVAAGVAGRSRLKQLQMYPFGLTRLPTTSTCDRDASVTA